MNTKYVFVINPKAGKRSHEEEIRKEIETFSNFDYEVYITKCCYDAEKFSKAYCEDHRGQNLVFVSCGGDGTLHEVVNGVVGYPNVAVACYPVGSGNDFVKNWGKISDFRSVKDLVEGRRVNIDLLNVNNEYCVNIVSVGFDAEVQFRMQKYRRIPLLGGPVAYNLAVINSLLFKMSSQMKLTIDDEVAFEGKTLLCAIANGICYGGGYFCAPLAKINDGIIDCCMLKKISRFKAPSLIGVYKEGKHIESKEIKPYLIYQKCRKVVVESSKPVAFQTDGEPYRTKKLVVELERNKLQFIVPNFIFFEK